MPLLGTIDDTNPLNHDRYTDADSLAAVVAAGYGTTYYPHAKYVREINPTTGGGGTTNAVPNTGGGGGGRSYWAVNVGWYAGSGSAGSGIVIVRYLINQTVPVFASFGA